MTPISWVMPASVYEDMVACLLNHLNSETRRIDGSGGDGGRDVQFELPGGLHVFELKSFTGRMGKAQKPQVERSLERAAKLNPIRWELIVPIDPTPGELAWFKGLAAKYTFSIEWRGKTWLDTHFAERMFIWRYFCEGAKAEVLDLLIVMQKEQAGLANGMPDVIDRMRALADRGNELDPFYRFKLEFDGPRTKISIIPRYEGALQDRPITTHVQFQFDTKTPEGKAKLEELRLAYDFGLPAEIGGDFITSAEIDAPAGLGGSLTPSHISLGPGHSPGAEPIEVDFLAVDTAGEVVESLTITMTPDNIGNKGVIMSGRDRSGLVRAEVTWSIDPVPGNTSLSFDSGPFVPHELLGTARLLAALCAPNRMSLRTADGMLSTQPSPCPEEPLLDQAFAKFLSNLAMIQADTGQISQVEWKFELGDFSNAAAGAAMIRGDEASQPWDNLVLTWDESPTGDKRHQLANGPVHFAADIIGPAVVRICGQEYQIGRKRHIEAVGRLDPEFVELLNSGAAVTRAQLHPEPGTLLKIRVIEE